LDVREVKAVVEEEEEGDGKGDRNGEEERVNGAGERDIEPWGDGEMVKERGRGELAVSDRVGAVEIGMDDVNRTGDVEVDEDDIGGEEVEDDDISGAELEEDDIGGAELEEGIGGRS